MTTSFVVKSDDQFQVSFVGTPGLTLGDIAATVTTGIGPNNTFSFFSLTEGIAGNYDLIVRTTDAYDGYYTIWVDAGSGSVPIASVNVVGSKVPTPTGFAIDAAVNYIEGKKVGSFQHYGTYAPGEKVGLLVPMGMDPNLQDTTLTNVVVLNMTNNTSEGQIVLDDINSSLFGNGVYFASITAPAYQGTYLIQWAYGAILGTFNVSAGGSGGGLDEEVLDRIQNLEDVAMGSWQWDKSTGNLKFYRQDGDEFAEFNVVEDATTASRERI